MIKRDELGRLLDPEEAYRQRNNLASDAVIPIVDFYLPGGLGDTILSRAVRSGDIEQTQHWLRQKANPDVILAACYTVLGMAARQNNLEMAKMLLANKANPNAGEADCLPLDMASKDDMRSLLTKAGALSSEQREANAIKQGGSVPQKENVPILVDTSEQMDILQKSLAAEKAGKPLSLTRAIMFRRDVSELEKMIEDGANVNGLDAVFGSPLEQAIMQRSSLDVFKLLVAKGANRNVLPADGSAPLASLLGLPELVDLFLKAGADPNGHSSDNTPLLTLAVQKERADAFQRLLVVAKVDGLDERGMPALHYALSEFETRRSFAQALLDKGAAVDIGRMRGLASLDWSAAGAADMAVQLLSRNAKPYQQKDGRTLLLWAIEDGHQTLFEAAMRLGPPLDRCTGDDCEKPLKAAVRSERTEMARALIKAGAPINNSMGARGEVYVNSYGEKFAGVDDLLCFAISENVRPEMIALLIQSGVDVNAHENSMEQPTPLYKAVEKKRADVVSALLAAKAQVDKLNYYGRTPLYEAVDRGNEEIVKLLLGAGADPLAGRKPEDRPLNRARGEGDESIIKLLESAGRR